MPRQLLFALLLLSAFDLAAFDRVKRPLRIAVLPVAETLHDDAGVADLVVGRLKSELEEQGFEAIDAGVGLGDLRAGEGPDADYYVELGAASTDGDLWGVAGAGTAHVSASMSLVVARASGELRIYDGRTVELLTAVPLERRSRALMPLSIGVGGRNAGVMLAIPLLNHLQFRRAAAALGRDAAREVIEAIRIEAASATR